MVFTTLKDNLSRNDDLLDSQKFNEANISYHVETQEGFKVIH
jgi:hypothetical protein